MWKGPSGHYPDPVQLEGRDLPWVETALHLGHILNQHGKMHKEYEIHRAIFIDRSLEVKKQLSYTDPAEVLRATAVYCCDGYGAMLWPYWLKSQPSSISRP